MVIGRAAGDGAADIEEVAIAVGACAQHRIAEGNGVALAPGHVLAQLRAMAGVIGRTGPGRPAAHGLIGLHQPGRHVAAMGIVFDDAGIMHIQPADIERSGDGNLGAARHQPLGEMHAAIAVIQRAIDMGGGDRDHPRGPQHPPHLAGNAHGHGGGLAVLAAGHLPFNVGQFHGRQTAMGWA